MGQRKLTNAQKQCLRAIFEAGSAVKVKGGRWLASGEFLPFAPATLLELVSANMLTFSEPRRVIPTPIGAAFAQSLPTYDPPYGDTP